MKKSCVLSAGVLCLLAGSASAQVTVNGALDGSEAGLYGSIRWVQNVPTGFGDNAPISGCSDANIGNPAGATTGVEIKIPLTALGGWQGNIRVLAFLNGSGHDGVSNQTLPGLPALTDSLGDPRSVSFAAQTGNQFVEIVPSAGADPVIDGTLDGAAYGAAVALQTNRTSFGDSTDGLPDTCNGSELNGMYAVIRNGSLYIMLTGNMQSNFNKLELFIDTDGGTGFNLLDASTIFPDVDFQSLQRMQSDGLTTGLTFDAGFTADYYMTFGCGNAPVTHYPNFANLVAGTGGYLGSAVTGSGSGALTGGANPDNIEVAVNNSNTVGVPGRCPPPTGNRDNANGSELNGLYGFIDTANGRLNLLLTGNLQTNYNKIDLFFDTTATDGQNTVRNDNPDVNFNNLNNNIGTSTTQAGLTFDAGFFADYFLSFTNGPGVNVFADACVLRDNGRLRDFSANSLDYGTFDGGAKAAFDPMTYSGPRIDPQDGFTPNIYANYGPRLAGNSLTCGTCNPLAPVGTPGLISLSIDNSNIAGVTSTSATGAELVTTGLEVSISLAELGWDGTSCIKVAGFIANGSHDFMSNQVIGGLPGGSTNLGDTQLVNFASIAGDQFVSICPPVTCGSADFDGDGDTGTDADIEAFFACLGGNCCATCGTADFDQDGDTGTDADIEAFFRVLGGGTC